MSEEIKNEFFKGVYSNRKEAHSFAAKCSHWIDNTNFDLKIDDDQVVKIREWGRLRGNIKMHLNDIKKNSELLNNEEAKLAKVRENSSDPQFKNDVEIIDKKYKHHDLLSSLRRIEAQLENKLIYIAELQETEREVFNHNAAGDQTSSLNSSNIRTFASERSNTRVVSLKIPEFHGEYESFAEFIAGYNDLIHDNPEYSDSTKSMYFKNAIRGKAAKVIRGIPATGANYQLMYDKIIAKFSRASLNKHTILLKLENLLPASENALSLQDKIDDIEEILNLLNAANIGIDKSTDPMWHRLILRKFPNKIADKVVEEHYNDEKFTIRDLITTVENYTFAIRFREEANISSIASAPQTSAVISGNTKGYRNLSGKNEENSQSHSNSNGFTVAASNPNCLLCDSTAHKPENCTLPREEKIRAVKRKRLCWKCFQPNHRSSECEASNCRCGDNHHVTLCRNPRTWNNNNNDDSRQNANRGVQPQGNSANQQFIQPYNHRSSHQTTNDPRNQNVNNFRHARTNGQFNNNQNKPYEHNNRNEIRTTWQNESNIPRRSNWSEGRSNNFVSGNHASFIEPPFDEHQSDRPNDNSLQIGHTAIESEQCLPIIAHTSTAGSRTDAILTEPAVLMTCEARIYDRLQNKYVTAILFFDTGSQQTLINENFAKSLGIQQSENIEYTVCGVNNHAEKITGCKLNLNLLDASDNVITFSALTKPFISRGFRTANLDNIDITFLQSKGLKIANSKINGEMLRPDILIGADNYYALTAKEPTILLPSSLQVFHTSFGACIFGRKSHTCTKPSERLAPEIAIHSLITEDSEEISPNEMLKEMYELESLGIKHNGSPSVENTVKYFNQYKGLIDFSNNIVTAPFPLKEDISKLSSNYKMANVRLMSLISNFAKNTNMRDCYVRKMEEYKAEGIIELVDQNEINLNEYSTFYIPHHGVWNPAKKEKPLRIVFDASSSQKGSISLNQAIHTGEVFVNKISDIVLSARKSKYIIMCDIQSAYTNIRLPRDHQDLCRFLWLADPSKPATKENIRVFRFKRLPFGINASSSILNMAIVSFLEQNETELASEILKMLYVDNVVINIDNVDDLWPKMKELKEIFAQISFNMREFVTNVPTVNERIVDKDKGTFGETKLLGVPYNTDSDLIKVRIALKREERITKRTVVKQVHSIFDPIGLLAPSLISLRFRMREVFASTNHWNDKLSHDMESEWKHLIDKYNNAEIIIPRYIGNEHQANENQILWVFTDASKQALAACAYLQNEKGKEVSTLLCGKSKLTPKTKVPLEDTIPKFELISILLGMEIAKNVITSLELSDIKVYIVNDSTSALSWVTLSKRLRKSCELVREKIVNAVNTLQQNFNISTRFFHCATDLNTADIATRGISPHELQNSEWVNGPKWIGDSVENLPITPYVLKVSETDENIPAEEIQVNQVVMIANQSGEINVKQCESAERAKWIIAKILKVLKRKVETIRKRSTSEIEMGPLWSKLSNNPIPTATDLSIAEKAIVIHDQSKLTTRELQQKYKQREIVEDEVGIKRFKSRMQNAELSYDNRNPIFLPNSSQFLRLLVKEYHEQFGHMGREYMKMIIRQRFWVPRPTKVINQVLKICLPCKISNSLPFKAPTMPSLPIDRVKGNRAFENTGVDCLGPFKTIEHEKVYVCLYTCLVIRAVHLEVVNELSGSEFLKSFIRFTSRRGIPKIMRSDNGTNFVLSQKVIQAAFEKDENGESTIDYSEKRAITWLFNPPKAPFMGGVWERLVRTVKSSFYKSVGRRNLTLSDFHTSITKIEAIVNSRPLTAIDNNDLINPIRPCDFICPGSDLITPNFNKYEEDQEYTLNELANLEEAKEKLSTIEQLLSSFWARFQKEYLINLRDQQKLRLRQGRCARSKGPEINEIVLIQRDNHPKNKWKLGKVTKLITGNDGEVRSAILSCNGKRVHRPLVNLYSLEVPSTNIPGNFGNFGGEPLDLEQIQVKEDSSSQESESEKVSNQRPARKTKIVARQRIKESTKTLEQSSEYESSDSEIPI